MAPVTPVPLVEPVPPVYSVAPVKPSDWQVHYVKRCRGMAIDTGSHDTFKMMRGR